MKYLKRVNLARLFATTASTGDAGLAFPVHRRHHPLTRLLVTVVVLSLALVTVPCCTLFGSAYAAPVTAADHHAGEHHESGHSHSTPDLPNGDSGDHCAHWVDANPFLTSSLALLGSSVDSPAWHRTAIADLALRKPPAQRILRPPIHLRTSFPRLYLLYAHLLL